MFIWTYDCLRFIAIFLFCVSELDLSMTLNIAAWVVSFLRSSFFRFMPASSRAIRFERRVFPLSYSWFDSFWNFAVYKVILFALFFHWSDLVVSSLWDLGSFLTKLLITLLFTILFNFYFLLLFFLGLYSFEFFILLINNIDFLAIEHIFSSSLLFFFLFFLNGSFYF
jgi:hypothetical protein